MQLELRNKRITLANNNNKNNNMCRKQLTGNEQQLKGYDSSNSYRNRRCCYGHMVLLIGCCMVMNQILLNHHFTAIVSAFTINQNEKNAYRCNIQMRRLFPQQRRRRIVPPLQQEQQLLPSSSLQLVATTSTTATTTTTSTPTPTSSSSSSNDLFLPPNIQYADAVVCGGGPTGLLTAIMLAQQEITTTEGTTTTTTTKSIKRFPNIHVYDRLNTPVSNPDLPMIWDGTLSNIAKFYLIGLGGRGQRALQYFHLWDTIVAPRCVSVIGRRDWTPETPNGTISIKPIRNNITTQVLPRDKLVSILYQHIMEQYSNQITCYYNTEVQPIDFYYNNCTSNTMMDDSADDDGKESTSSSSSETALVRVAKCSSSTAGSSKGEDEDGTSNVSDNIMCDTDIHYVSTPLLIAADGTVRTIANTISYFDNERIQHIPRHNIIQRYMARRNAMYVKRYVDDNQRVYKTIPLKFPKDWRCDLNYSARTKRLNLEALPANRDGEYCGVLLLKHNDPIAKANTDPQELRRIFDEMIPQFSTLIDDTTLASIAKKPVSYLPNFRYVGPRLHEGRCTVLLGDCAHTVKPYFGLGANSALEDVMLLSQYLSRYMNDTSKALYEFSKFRAPESKVLVRISRDLDRPGKLGFITFIGPIILDAIFQKIAPKIFLPNVITMLQRENYTFQQLAYRKRWDRMIQLSIIGTGVSVVGCTVTAIVNWISKLLGVRSIYLWTSFILSAFVLNRFKTTISNQAIQA